MSDLLPRPVVNPDSYPVPTSTRPRLSRAARRRSMPTPASALVLAALALLAVAGPARSAPVQWPISEGGNGHYYEYVNPLGTPSITWTQARDAAAARTFMGVNGHLATITSDAERLFVFNQYSRVPSVQSWIGGVQPPGAATPAAGWTWVTGEPWEVTAWATGEPNDYPNLRENGEEQYLSMLNYITNSPNGAWNDNTNLGVPSAYIVEYPVLPEPASAALMGLATGAMLTRRRTREQAPSRTVATSQSGG